MLLEDHELRVARLLRGEKNITDLDRLFADLRFAKPGRSSVQEIGHFAAHRDERDSGISLERANDIQTSARLWHRQALGVRPSIEDLKEAARANFNIIPDDRIRERLGISRQTAKQSFMKGIRKYEAGRPLKAREAQVVKMFGLSMMWQYALSDSTLCSDLSDLLVDEGSLAGGRLADFANVRQFVALYALSIMHGANLKMADGATTRLRIAVSEGEGLLRIKADIPVGGTKKPVTSSVPIFETSLPAESHCDPSITSTASELIPVEIVDDRLVQLR